MGAILREQNALPNGVWTGKNLSAKDDVDNVGAGRAAKGENPSACATNKKRRIFVPSFLFVRVLV